MRAYGNAVDAEATREFIEAYTGDAEGAANAALSRAAALSQPAAFSPLASLFGTFTSALGTQAAAERSAAYGGGPAPRYNTGLFAPKSSSVRVQ